MYFTLLLGFYYDTSAGSDHLKAVVSQHFLSDYFLAPLLHSIALTTQSDCNGSLQCG